MVEYYRPPKVVHFPEGVDGLLFSGVLVEHPLGSIVVGYSGVVHQDTFPIAWNAPRFAVKPDPSI